MTHQPELLPDSRIEDVLTIAKYVGFDIATFNRFINAAKMCGYELVRKGVSLQASAIKTPDDALEKCMDFIEIEIVKLIREASGDNSFAARQFCEDAEMALNAIRAALAQRPPNGDGEIRSLLNEIVSEYNRPGPYDDWYKRAVKALTHPEQSVWRDEDAHNLLNDILHGIIESHLPDAEKLSKITSEIEVFWNERK